MTNQQAAILATALKNREEARKVLTGYPYTALAKWADQYVHEQRIINRIINEAHD